MKLTKEFTYEGSSFVAPFIIPLMSPIICHAILAATLVPSPITPPNVWTLHSLFMSIGCLGIVGPIHPVPVVYSCSGLAVCFRGCSYPGLCSILIRYRGNISQKKLKKNKRGSEKASKGQTFSELFSIGIGFVIYRKLLEA